MTRELGGGLRLRLRAGPPGRGVGGVERARDGRWFVTSPVGGQDADLFDQLRQELCLLGPPVDLGGLDAGVLGEAVDQDDQTPQSEEAGLSWLSPESAGVEAVESAEVGLDVSPALSEEPTSPKDFPRSTP